MARPMTTLSTPLPSFLASQSSNLVGCSSSTPPILLLSSSVFMPVPSIVTMLTAPRTKGQPIHLCFFAGDT